MPIIGGMVNPNKGMEPVPRYGTWRSNRPMATSYTMTGPTSGTSGVASTAFTVSIPETIAVHPVTITPADAGTGTAGVFSPTSIVLTDTQHTGTFTYTPGSTGTKVISVTNDSGQASPDDGGTALANPSSINYVSS